MSTDTMYFNSSRLLPLHGKNRSSVSLNSKKNSIAVKKNKVKQETLDFNLPQPQTLPNGEKPNFGNSNSNSDGNTSKNKKHNKPKSKKGPTTSDLSQDLKNLLLQNNESTKVKSKTVKRNSKQSEGDISPVSQQSTSTQSTPLTNYMVSPINTPLSLQTTLLPSVNPMTMSLPSPHQNGNIPMKTAGLPPQLSPIHQQQPLYSSQQPQQHVGPVPPFQMPGYPYAQHSGNYSLKSVPLPLPQQVPMVNPMYPYHFPNGNSNQAAVIPQLYPMHPPHPQQHHNPEFHQQHDEQRKNPIGNNRSSRPNSSSSSHSSNNSQSSRKSKTRSSSHSFAGASFATDVPQECNLPKPSFL